MCSLMDDWGFVANNQTLYTCISNHMLNSKSHFAFTFYSGFAQSKTNVKDLSSQKKEITEQDYLDAQAFFDGDEISPEKLKESMNKAMTYLMFQQDNQGQMVFDKSFEASQKRQSATMDTTRITRSRNN